MSAPVSAFVLDCSIAVSWLVADEASAKTDRLLERLRDDGALVPALWHLELGNVLARAEKHRRITAAQIAAIVELVNRLPITADTDHGRALKEVLSLARAESLAIYDAAYLELAMRHGIPLATLDKTLVKAANRVKVKTLPA